MSEWKEINLTDITSKIGDGLHGTPLYDDSGDYHFINGNNLNQGKVLIKPDTKRVNKDEYLKYVKPLSDKTILLSINGTIGNLASYNGEKCMLGKSACFINVNELTERKFLYYVLCNKDFQYFITENATGTTIPNVPLKGIREYSFNLPPLPEQKAIAEVLSSLDDKIDLLHRQNKTLEQMAESLFRQWFIEEAKDDWEEKSLKELVDIAIGRTPPRKESQWFSKNSKDVKWISIKDMGNDGVFMFNTSEHLTIEAVEMFNIPTIPKDTVVLSFKMTLGRVGITSEEMLSNEAIAHFKFRQKTPFTKEYLYLFLKTYPYETLGSTSSIVTSINSTMIKDIMILIPNEQTMRAFQSLTEDNFSKIKSNQSQVHTLEKLRDTLLPKLMNGEVKVKV